MSLVINGGNGVTVVWRGWFEPHNQIVIYGWWAVHRAGDDHFIYATTLGDVGRAEMRAEMFTVIDTVRKADWPPVYPWSTSTLRRELQTRALNALMDFAEFDESTRDAIRRAPVDPVGL